MHKEPATDNLRVKTLQWWVFAVRNPKDRLDGG